MYIKHISLYDFRNYGRLELDVGPSVNIIYGNNAQGKTNLIEAVNVCTSIMSHRTSKDRDLIKFGSSGYKIRLDLHDEEYDNDTSLSAEFEATETGARRILSQDGLKIDRISDYMGICNTVIFAPEDLNLVKGAPSGRRKFFNILISKVSPSYYDILNRTNRLINQKNATLKSLGGNTDAVNDQRLDFWDFALADISAEMILQRYRFSILLAIKASEHHSVISGGKEKLEISYSTVSGVYELLERFFEEKSCLSDFMAGRLSEAFSCEIKHILSDHLLEKFKASRKNDILKGITAIGIHRDDLDIKLDGLPMRLYSSQGQQRSASLSLKLAELEIIKDQVSTSPILLLDDVFSELDSGRRVSLLAGMKNAQIFITCTDRKYIENELSGIVTTGIDTRYFKITSGEVISE